LGLASIYDNRDNVMNPYKGNYAEVSSYFYRTALGGTYNFEVVNAEFRKYFRIKPKHIIAFQSKARLASGDVPFLDMSMVGGDDLLRSYARNRFRDKNMFGAQVEYRFPVYWRFGLTTFAGAGDVFNKTTDLNLNSLKYCIGGGLRFLMNSAERLNIRIDYGYGPDGGQYYVSFAEAF
jgi:outer membrane protein assembly factor BamA